MRDEGIDSYCEVGPKKVLSALVKRIHRQAKLVNVEDPGNVENARSLLNSAGNQETYC